MPLTTEHKLQTRHRIVECARQLFNRHGFSEVSIDEIMGSAGLTRGGFYNHFKTKGELYVAALENYAEKREAMNAPTGNPEFARRIFDHYASRDHVDDLDDQCPLMALPSDIARAGPEVRAAFERVLHALTNLFENNVGNRNGVSAHQQGLAIAATCVGAAVLARTLDDASLGDEICDAARVYTANVTGWSSPSGN